MICLSLESSKKSRKKSSSSSTGRKVVYVFCGPRESF